MSNTNYKTDILVIGGGMAGFFAAYKAKQAGMDVILVDKGYMGNTGQSPYAGTFSLFEEKKGDILEEWLEYANLSGEYLCNKDFTRQDFLDSKARLDDLIAFGVEVPKDENGYIFKMSGPPPKIGAKANEKISNSKSPLAAAGIKAFDSMKLLRKVLIKNGVKIVDRMMITNLLTNQNNTVVGAFGITVDDAKATVFNAKAVILCTGASSFKPNGWPIANLTSDGDAMAYRIGAEISGKEFQDAHEGRSENAAYQAHRERPDARPIFGQKLNSAGETYQTRTTNGGTLFIDSTFAAHKGEGPIYLHSDRLDKPLKWAGSTTLGMGVHKSEGIFPKSVNCDTSIEGLYAAGDALCTMNLGAIYSGIGVALMGSATTGARAGINAAEYCKNIKRQSFDQKQIDQIEKEVFEPLNRKTGFCPRWTTQLLYNTMVPYFVLYIKHENRLQAALTTVEFIRDHILPKLFATDAHELRLAIEVKNMTLNAEMKLRASLARKESRGCHFREDFPIQNDDYLAWLILKNDNGQMHTEFKPVPEKWRPNADLSFEQRYPYKFPY